MNIVQLHQALNSHELWVKSSGQSGVRANLANQDLSLANFTNRILSGASFQGATLSLAIFDSCVLDDVDFSSANLDNATFTNAVVTNCSFYNASIEGTSFQDTALEGSDFTGVELEVADFRGASMATTKVDKPVYQFKIPSSSGLSYMGGTRIGNALRVGTSSLPISSWLDSEDNLTPFAQEFATDNNLALSTLALKLKFFASI